MYFIYSLFIGFIVFMTPAEGDLPKLRVVASFSILGDVIHNVGGDLIDLSVIVGANQDPHAYEPTPSDGRKFEKADVIFINGLGLEGWMSRLINACEACKERLIKIGDSIELRLATMTPGGAPMDPPVPDPHFWHDIKEMKKCVTKIAEILSHYDPSHASDYQKRAKDYLQLLNELDEWIVNELAEIPPPRRLVITSHDAFNYFGKRYGVEFLAPVGVSTDAEPSAKDLAHLTNQIKASGAQAMFIENVANPKLIQQLAEETKIDINGTLYADALSTSEGEADTYIKMMRYNVKTMVQALHHQRE